MTEIRKQIILITSGHNDHIQHLNKTLHDLLVTSTMGKKGNCK